MKVFTYVVKSSDTIYIFSVTAETRDQAEKHIENHLEGKFVTLVSHEASLETEECAKVGFHQCRL